MYGRPVLSCGNYKTRVESLTIDRFSLMCSIFGDVSYGSPAD
jgi:hypothetical protein